ncbi:mediator of RNA polymerase II transcription subunit 8 [Ophidiomyces ophidiicola]|nr:mediator of RNA polymerase II transcription subunit 8 [Ophidiomyces ophidiicola]
MTSIGPEQLKALEQTRQRLVQLTQSLGSLANSISQSDPLPAWSSLQSQATIISNNLLSISQLLTEQQGLLASIVAYPTPEFPGRTESTILHQLLRTKLEPRVEEWVARGRAVAKNNTASSQLQAQDGNESARLSVDQLLSLWHWAPVEANMEARQRDWGGDYTLEEREMGIMNVITGLSRKLDEGDEEEDDDDEDEDIAGDDMEVIVGAHARAGGAPGVEFDIARGSSHTPPKPMAPGLPLEDVFRYMTTGATPSPR